MKILKITHFVAIGFLFLFSVVGISAHAGGLTDLIKAGDLEGVLGLVNEDNINEPDDNGMTALMVAVSIGDLEISGQLIELGADVNRPGEMDAITNTPMAIAAWNNDSDMLDLLLGHHAEDPWLSRIDGFDPYGLHPYTYTRDDIDEFPGWIESLLDENLPPFIVDIIKDQFIHGPCDSGIERNIFNADSDYGQDRNRFQSVKFSDGVLIENFVIQPAYISNGGIVYPRGIYRIEEGGPFVTVRIEEHTAVVKSARVRLGGRSFELANVEHKVYEGVIGPVDECESMLIELCRQNGDVVAMYEVTSELRGAVPEAVYLKMSRWPGNSESQENSEDNDDHGQNGNRGHGHHGH